MTILLTVNPAEDDDDHAWMVDDEDARDNPEKGDVTKKLDDGMYPVIEAAKAGDVDSKTKIDKRYRKYARAFAMNELKAIGIYGGVAGLNAREIEQDVMERLLVGRNGRRPVIERFLPGKATLATLIGGIVKRVVRERKTKHARGRERAASGPRGEEGAVESEIEAFADTAPTPEETVSADEVEEIPASEMTMKDLKALQESIASGELSSQAQYWAEIRLEEWRTGNTAAKRKTKAEQREAFDLAMDAAGSGGGLTSDEAAILAMREGSDEQPSMTYKQIAKELFGDTDKKSVQKVMVRLHRARKSLEKTMGIPLRGVEAQIGGVALSGRGRKRKNPELVIYFEDVTDIEELLQVGLLDPAGYQACLASLLQCLET